MYLENQRSLEKKGFLDKVGCADATPSFLAGDCSCRTYFSVHDTNGHPYVLMDAPPGLEDVRPFIRIQKVLSKIGCTVPIIYQADEENGFLLLEDCGRNTYENILNSINERDLYTLAVDVLVHIHKTYKENTEHLVSLEWKDYQRELSVFIDWYYFEVLQEDYSPTAAEEFYCLWHDALSDLPTVPQSIILRDYHAGNIMYLEDRVGIEKCGLLDFQDACFGPRPYDLVSLLEDARRDISHNLQSAMYDRYCDAFTGLNKTEFFDVYTTLGAQRSIKILGIFKRMEKQSKKDVYLTHIPRVWRWIAQDFKNPRLAPIKKWLETNIPMAHRHV